MEAHPSSTSDLLSSLPKDVLDSILKLLPMKEAVRTSILSRKWRYVWTTLPKLDFSDVQLPGLGSNIMGIMNQVLSQHMGTIVNFRLSKTIFSETPDVQRWIRIICGKRVQEFIFLLDTGTRYMVPSTLFSCDSLKCLMLSKCIISVPSEFRAFGKLTRLRLYEVSFVDIDGLQNLLSKCPNLTDLDLIEVYSTTDLSNIAPRLQKLFIIGDFGDLDVVMTPNLRHVAIHVDLSDGGDEPLRNYVGGYVHHLVRALHHRDSLETLELASHTIMYLLLTGAAAQESLDLVCGNLETLKLGFHFGDRKETAAVLRLIRDCPRLKELEIVASSDHFVEQWPIEDYWATVSPFDSSFNCLEKVRIEDFSGTEPQLAFMRFVLANSKVLKTLHLELKKLYVEDAARLVLIQLLRFRRRSKLAEVEWMQNW